MDAVKDRLHQFITHENITVAEFERTCRLSNGLISKPHRLSRTTITKIAEAYPALNREWLETGEGEMTNTEPAPKAISITHSSGFAATVNGNATAYPIQEHDELIRLKEENRQLRERIAELKDLLNAAISKSKDGGNG